MFDTDRPRFAKALYAVMAQADYKIDREGIEFFFRALHDKAITEVEWALYQHARTSPYRPKVSDIVRLLDGEPPSTDQVIALARTRTTPLGVFAAIQIGSHDLAAGDARSLTQRAHEVLVLLPDFVHRSRAGELTLHEQAAMAKYGVEPDADPAPGIPGRRTLAAISASRPALATASPRRRLEVQP